MIIRFLSGRRAAIVVGIGLVLLGSAPAEAQQAMNDLTTCWRNAITANATTACDPAETVVEKTYLQCNEQEIAFHLALRQAGGPLGRQRADDMFDQIKVRTHATLLSLVDKARAAKGLCR